jgi:alpha-tubulin suppressor-like RCC1 family protein
MRRDALGIAFLCVLACRDTTGAKADVPLLLSDIAAGYYTTCGLGVDGTAYCWGNGRYGQLGVDSADECSSVPGEDPCAHTARRVAGGLTFTKLVAGGAHFCALTPAGLVYCWGDDRFGQLGTLDTAAICGFAVPGPCARTPQLAYLPPPATQVSAGDSHTCALVDVSYCWGYGLSGQLGLGSNVDSPQPRVVAAGMRFRSIAVGGSTSCGIAVADSATYCWGNNHLGQLGDSSRTAHNLPQRVVDTTRFVALAVGTAHACGITPLGNARCWGAAEGGELGDGATAPDCGGYGCRTTPVSVSGNLQFTTLAAGTSFTCGTTATASYCWGQVPGLGTRLSVPTAFGTQGTGGGTPFTAVTTAYDHACGITAAHEAYCWGGDYHGKLGDGPAEATSDTPLLVIAPDSTATPAP